MSDNRAVLLVMDYQNGIIERSGGEALIGGGLAAVAAARKAGVPVMFVRVAFRAGYPEAAGSNQTFGRVVQFGDAMTQDHPATQLHPALEARPDEPVILKRRVSAFSGSDLDVLLRGAGAGTLVLAGISTSGVVLSTLRQAADLDYRLVVLADACIDPDPEVHRVLTEKVFPRQAQVTTVEEWAATL
ncbi:isochorismatase family cysteine hydrolase [Dactylosporangium salmoneum]|uniref:Cysteine hydrolase n=1 Tax=Dactylosporangium salmoneum TaxID=53361 RepID=A0ABP5U7I4_9ACTN